MGKKWKRWALDTIKDLHEAVAYWKATSRQDEADLGHARGLLGAAREEVVRLQGDLRQAVDSRDEALSVLADVRVNEVGLKDKLASANQRAESLAEYADKAISERNDLKTKLHLAQADVEALSERLTKTTEAERSVARAHEVARQTAVTRANDAEAKLSEREVAWAGEARQFEHELTVAKEGAASLSKALDAKTERCKDAESALADALARLRRIADIALDEEES